MSVPCLSYGFPQEFLHEIHESIDFLTPLSVDTGAMHVHVDRVSRLFFITSREMCKTMDRLPVELGQIAKRAKVDIRQTSIPLVVNKWRQKINPAAKTGPGALLDNHFLPHQKVQRQLYFDLPPESIEEWLMPNLLKTREDDESSLSSWRRDLPVLQAAVEWLERVVEKVSSSLQHPDSDDFKRRAKEILVEDFKHCLRHFIMLHEAVEEKIEAVERSVRSGPPCARHQEIHSDAKTSPRALVDGHPLPLQKDQCRPCFELPPESFEVWLMPTLLKTREDHRSSLSAWRSDLSVLQATVEWLERVVEKILSSLQHPDSDTFKRRAKEILLEDFKRCLRHFMMLHEAVEEAVRSGFPHPCHQRDSFILEDIDLALKMAEATLSDETSHQGGSKSEFFGFSLRK